MKYLREFSRPRYSLQDFSEMYLANLLDEDFKIEKKESNLAFVSSITLTRLMSFKWGFIKDSFIPYIKMLESSYDIYNINFIFLQKESKSINVNSIKNDEINDDDKILFIIISVER